MWVHFPFGAITNNDLNNVLDLHLEVHIYIYVSVGYIPISGIAGLLKMEAFNYVKIIEIEIMPKCFPK